MNVSCSKRLIEIISEKPKRMCQTVSKIFYEFSSNSLQVIGL